jgi:hypothetical protein
MASTPPDDPKGKASSSQIGAAEKPLNPSTPKSFKPRILDRTREFAGKGFGIVGGPPRKPTK